MHRGIGGPVAGLIEASQPNAHAHSPGVLHLTYAPSVAIQWISSMDSTSESDFQFSGYSCSHAACLGRMRNAPAHTPTSSRGGEEGGKGATPPRNRARGEVERLRALPPLHQRPHRRGDRQREGAARVRRKQRLGLREQRGAGRPRQPHVQVQAALRVCHVLQARGDGALSIIGT